MLWPILIYPIISLEERRKAVTNLVVCIKNGSGGEKKKCIEKLWRNLLEKPVW
jgi:hypothetical protein